MRVESLQITGSLKEPSGKPYPLISDTRAQPIEIIWQSSPISAVVSTLQKNFSNIDIRLHGRK